MSVDSGGLPPGKKRKEDHVLQSDVDGEQDMVVYEDVQNRSGNIDSYNYSGIFDINQETVSPNISVQNINNIIPVQKQTERQTLFYKATDKGPYYVSNYIQKVILCHNCMRYGHLGKQCRSKPRCAKCFEEHSTSTCNHIPDDPKCFHCEGNHYTFEMRKCDEFLRQQNIKSLMATTNISYKDAEKSVPKKHTYARIASQNTNISPRTTDVQQPTYSEQHHTSSDNSPSTSRRTENLNNRSSRFTHFQTKPVKRSIPVSPDATEITRNQIVRQISTPNKPEGILRETIYQEHTNINRHTFIENVLEVDIATVSLISLYIKPQTRITLQEWSDFFNSLPIPFIIGGDFNLHHMAWGCEYNDPYGERLMEALNRQNLIFLNNGAPTYINCNRKSAIDLTICSPQLQHQRWNLNKVNWNNYYYEYLNTPHESVTDYNSFIQVVNQAAEATIPKYKNNVQIKRGKPWWTPECSEAINRRRDSFKIYQENPNLTNLLNFKRLDAKAKKVTKKTKRDSWHSYCSSLNSNIPLKKVWQQVNLYKNRRKDNYHFIDASADDFAISTRDKNISNTMTELDTAIVAAETWFEKNGSSVAFNKSSICTFTRSRYQPPDTVNLAGRNFKYKTTMQNQII
nr:unnamed protein product [Callosobruchus chinensis]